MSKRGITSESAQWDCERLVGELSLAVGRLNDLPGGMKRNVARKSLFLKLMRMGFFNHCWDTTHRRKIECLLDSTVPSDGMAWLASMALETANTSGGAKFLATLACVAKKTAGISPLKTRKATQRRLAIEAVTGTPIGGDQSAAMFSFACVMRPLVEALPADVNELTNDTPIPANVSPIVTTKRSDRLKAVSAFLSGLRPTVCDAVAILISSLGVSRVDDPLLNLAAGYGLASTTGELPVGSTLRSAVDMTTLFSDVFHSGRVPSTLDKTLRSVTGCPIPLVRLRETIVERNEMLFSPFMRSDGLVLSKLYGHVPLRAAVLVKLTSDESPDLPVAPTVDGLKRVLIRWLQNADFRRGSLPSTRDMAKRAVPPVQKIRVTAPNLEPKRLSEVTFQRSKDLLALAGKYFPSEAPTLTQIPTSFNTPVCLTRASGKRRFVRFFRGKNATNAANEFEKRWQRLAAAQGFAEIESKFTSEAIAYTVMCDELCAETTKMVVWVADDGRSITVLTPTRSPTLEDAANGRLVAAMEAARGAGVADISVRNFEWRNATQSWVILDADRAESSGEPVETLTKRGRGPLLDVAFDAYYAAYPERRPHSDATAKRTKL